MNTLNLDTAIIGSGPAGLAAAVEARRLGIKDLVVFERNDRPGGILNQCIHNGFGISKFKAELTGPEYATRYIRMAEDQGVNIELNSMVLDLDKDKTIDVASARHGIKRYRCKSIVLAMGCRERPRGALDIPGERPAGIYTAGSAQRLMNVEGYMPGNTVVILGSGDIGMIMARRLTLEGARVKAVVEVLPYTSGLIRNEVQCLNDFDIPLLLEHTLVDIHGSKRVEGVTISRVDRNRRPIPETDLHMDCDTILLSVGLIPENELSRRAGLAIDNRTGGPLVNHRLETKLPGLFVCGNVLHVNDIADNVSTEGEIAARSAWERYRKIKKKVDPVTLQIDESIGQVVPHNIDKNRDARISLRVKQPMGPMTVHAGDIFQKKYPYARPGEMLWFTIPQKALKLLGSNANKLRLSCKEKNSHEPTG